MSNFNFINPYKNDPSVGHLETPITVSMMTRVLLANLPIYRSSLGKLVGTEIGAAHGYFLLGPFVTLGPLRNSDISLLAGFMSTIGLIIILTIGLKIYGIAQYGDSTRYGLEPFKFSRERAQLNVAWDNFISGFVIGGFSGAGFAYLILFYLK